MFFTMIHLLIICKAIGNGDLFLNMIYRDFNKKVFNISLNIIEIFKILV